MSCKDNYSHVLTAIHSSCDYLWRINGSLASNLTWTLSDIVNIVVCQATPCTAEIQLEEYRFYHLMHLLSSGDTEAVSGDFS